MFSLKQTTFGALCALVLGFTACKDKDDTPTTIAEGYENGILIVNEGPFQSGSGAVNHYDRTTKTVTNDIFAAANNGAKVGNILQSIATLNGKTYLLVNNANRVWVVDSKTFKFQDTLRKVQSPRYFQAFNNSKAYVSSWATGVEVIDLASNKIRSTIKTGKGPDRMLLDGTLVWVLNSGGFEKDSTISLIDVGTDAVVRTLKAAPAPNTIVSANGSIWVLCGGYFDLKGEGTLLEYKSNTIVSSYKVPKYASSLAVNKDGKTLYFLANNAIYSKDATTKTAPAIYIDKVTANRGFKGAYALGYDNQNNTLVCGDAKDFIGSGMVYVFNPSTKVLQDSIKAGIVPSSFSFGK